MSVIVRTTIHDYTRDVLSLSSDHIKGRQCSTTKEFTDFASQSLLLTYLTNNF